VTSFVTYLQPIKLTFVLFYSFCFLTLTARPPPSTVHKYQHGDAGYGTLDSSNSFQKFGNRISCHFISTHFCFHLRDIGNVYERYFPVFVLKTVYKTGRHRKSKTNRLPEATLLFIFSLEYLFALVLFTTEIPI